MVGDVPGVTSPVTSRAFDAAVALGGAGIGLALVVGALTDLPNENLAYYLGIPVIMIMCRFPMRFGLTGAGFAIGFEFCVLVFLAGVIDPVQAIAVWTLGVALGQLTISQRLRAMLFNAGLSVLAGTLAVVVIHNVRGNALTQPRELLAAALGAAVYFLVDYAVSGISIALEERTRVLRQLAEPHAPRVLAGFLAIASLGYLAALVVRELPVWSISLFAVPVITILVAVRARARGGEQARRLKVLLDTSTDVHQLADEPAVLAALRTGAADMLRDGLVELRSTVPRGKEVGALVHGSEGPVWIVGPKVDRVGASTAEDHQGLVALAAVATGALTRLHMSAEITKSALHDALTGLPNRALFLDRLEHSIQMDGRRGGRSAVLFCDLDGFKHVNDMFGHVAGDELLAEVARRIKGCVREVDTVARWGGDEFAVLLEAVRDPADISVACERILKALRGRIHVLDEDVSIAVTIGVAHSEGGESADALLSQADMAMYHAKAEGKNRYETYLPAFGDERLRRIDLVERLRRAIDAKEFELLYQTVVDLRNREVYGVEALVRWRHKGELVRPDEFIQTAEESGLIVDLGAIVLDLVTADAPRLRAAAGRRIAVGINLSAQQLQLEQFATQVLAARALMGDIDFVLEVTERDFVNNDPRTLAAMVSLAAADVRFAVDDFGIGFSSIGYLKRLPVRILKIDKSFLDRIEDDASACSLVRSMVVMGDALGLDVVVEGVERAGQLEHLIHHANATIGQGYLFGRPMPLAEMLTLLSAEPTTVNWAPHPIDPGQSQLAASHRAAAELATPIEIGPDPLERVEAGLAAGRAARPAAQRASWGRR